MMVSQKINDKLDVDINSISLFNFIDNWIAVNNVSIENITTKDESFISDIIKELDFFGIKTIKQLENFIPKDFAKNYNKSGYETNTYGLIRDWMLINDWHKIFYYPERKWILSENPNDLIDSEDQSPYLENFISLLNNYLSPEDLEKMFEEFSLKDE